MLSLNLTPIGTSTGWFDLDSLPIMQQPGTDPGETAREQAQSILVSAAAKVLTGPLIELLDSIRRDKEQAYRHLESYKGKQALNELTALVALIRRATGIDTHLAAFDETVRKNFQNWIMAHHAGPNPKFTDPQLAWLQVSRDHISTSFHLERDDLDMAPFDSVGGLGKMFQLFGERTDPLIAELNEALAA
jgi:type I restriction enzyme, R subunit